MSIVNAFDLFSFFSFFLKERIIYEHSRSSKKTIIAANVRVFIAGSYLPCNTSTCREFHLPQS